MQKSGIIQEPKWFLIDRVIRDRPGGHQKYRDSWWSRKDRRKQRRKQKQIVLQGIDEYYQEKSEQLREFFELILFCDFDDSIDLDYEESFIERNYHDYDWDFYDLYPDWD